MEQTIFIKERIQCHQRTLFKDVSLCLQSANFIGKVCCLGEGDPVRFSESQLLNCQGSCNSSAISLPSLAVVHRMGHPRSYSQDSEAGEAINRNDWVHKLV